MTMYEAISKRKSIRKYKKDVVPEKLLKQIEVFAKSITSLDRQIGVRFHILDNTKEEQRIKGLFKNEAPYYLVLYSEEKKGYEMNAGYMMEQLVLYLTLKGLGSCYLGGSKSARQEPGMKQTMIVAFGYADGHLYREQALAKRQSLKDLCVFMEEVEEPIRILLKAARLAPSSLNAQPWRFLIYHDRICVFACRDLFPVPKLTSMREVNIGIVLCHFMLGAEELWLDMKLDKEDSLKKKIYKNGEYMTTVFLQ